MFDLIEHYRRQTHVTNPEPYTILFDQLPNDVDGLIQVVQNILIHYQTDQKKLTPNLIVERCHEIDSRWVSTMIQYAQALDGSELAQYRPPHLRVLSTCRDFAVLLCAMMRHKQIPARVRYGFAHDQYKPERPMHDHVLVEFWDHEEERWKYAESRLHVLPEPLLDVSATDIPSHFFYTGGQIWRHIRQGTMNERDFSGYRFDKDYGQWLVRNLFLLDLASLSICEPLMWDSWGVLFHSKPGARITNPEQLAFLDDLAELDVRKARECDELITKFNCSQDVNYRGTIHSFSPVSQHYHIEI
ncbi:transglutaminase-like domain-containing protein [Vibrio ruber]|uniref:transglutaminase-like domain-containing protein n=1 Tax=Vibrio ruber TaxID=184755 RepID=UPI0028931E9F|nr:transglutaminase-like domain-containing protein [Vibrio ruber]WNJ94733.1 transglutaminase-like domain-containing protein [Vibrio ruber]